jgi:hypothetical protein
VTVGGSSAGAVAGERRHRGSTAAAARSPARGKARLSSPLQGVLGHAETARVGGASGWKVKFTMAAPMADGGGLGVARG